jgi:hypothetical protein
VALKRHSSTVARTFLHTIRRLERSRQGLGKTKRACGPQAGGHPPHIVPNTIAGGSLLCDLGHLALLPPDVGLQAFFPEAQRLGGYFYELIVGDEFDGLL